MSRDIGDGGGEDVIVWMLISWMLFPPLAKSNTWLRQDVDFAFSPAKGGDKAGIGLAANHRHWRVAGTTVQGAYLPLAGENTTSWAWAKPKSLDVVRGGCRIEQIQPLLASAKPGLRIDGMETP